MHAFTFSLMQVHSTYISFELDFEFVRSGISTPRRKGQHAIIHTHRHAQRGRKPPWADWTRGVLWGPDCIALLRGVGYVHETKTSLVPSLATRIVSRGPLDH
jgi:hypothetical protein